MSDPTPRVIRTPDQRLRVFVSSTLQEVADERQAARGAIEHLRLAPVMFELGARPHPPKDLYRAYLDQSHIFIGIYWQKYGWVAPDMTVSGLEDEYNLSGDKPKLIYIKSPAPDREPRLKELLDRIRNDDRVSYKSFLTPAELRDLIENDLAMMLTEHFEMTQVGEAAPMEPSPIHRHNLPAPPTRLIGRQKEVAAIHDLLLRDDAGLVTLSGPGGTGKTRLAVQVATEMLDHFEDGAFFVALAPIGDPSLVVPTIAQTLGVHETGDRALIDLVKDHLRDKHLLLLLDNFEQIVAAARQVSEVLEACPRLKILTTSRTSLHVRGEKEFPVPPLALPDRQRMADAGRLSQYAAVELFIQRALDVKPGFKVTNESAPAIAELCYRLDGLPLAIELAAARIKILSPQALLARFEHSLDMLKSGARDLPVRQQTMRNAIAWSHDLLSEAEKSLFRRLAVFAGGCTLQAAEFVGTMTSGVVGQASDVDFLDLIESLVSKSLLRQQETTDAEPRFAMLETIREYALERLSASPEAGAVRRRHAEYYLALARQAKQELAGTQQSRWLRYLDAEHDNVRAALAWALDRGETKIAAQTSGLIWRFWYVRGYLREGRKWLERAVAAARRDQLPASDWIEALNGAAALANNQGDYAQARILHTECLALRRELGDTRGVAVSLNNLGLVAENQGEYAEAIALYEESLALFRQLKDTLRIGGSLGNLGNVYMYQGNHARAAELQEEGLALERELGDTWGIALSLVNLAQVMLYLGNYTRAIALCEESLELHREMGNDNDMAFPLLIIGRAVLSQGDIDRALTLFKDSLVRFQTIEDRAAIVECLGRLAEVAMANGQPMRAAQLFGAQETLRAALGNPLPPVDRADYERHIAAVRAGLGDAAFDAASQSGRVMTLERAVSYALDERAHD